MKIVHTSYIGYIDTKVCGMNGPYAKAILSKIIFQSYAYDIIILSFNFAFTYSISGKFPQLLQSLF